MNSLSPSMPLGCQREGGQRGDAQHNNNNNNNSSARSSPRSGSRSPSRSPSPNTGRCLTSARGRALARAGTPSSTRTDEVFLPANEWAFPSSEVSIEQGEDAVLGRGSYGEVRVATWRGLKVAAKQLHALTGAQAASLSAEQAVEVRRDLLKEMSLLSSLRHPNLLLFLGVTYDTRSDDPLSIITELMPSSVYDLLETKHVQLEQSEVLDLAGDISRGLAYLHGHSPAIVHRDLSARNVLYDGRTAKLADLGQAKAMGVAVAAAGSRQTTMPGAMVYAAPEVLTGRYSSSIDVFSFGVLLAQLITGEYPRLDTRKEQVASAGNRFPALKPVLERCLSLHAEDRPAAAEASRALESLREDPCSYRPSGHGGGVLADRWFQEEQKERCRGLEARLHVHERRHSAELGRWKAEADRADELAGRIGTAENERDAAIKKRQDLEDSLRGVLAALEDERAAHDVTKGEVEKGNDRGRALDGEVEKLNEEVLRARRALKSAVTLQGLAEGNSSLATRTAEEAKEAKTKAELRAEQAEAQFAGQVAATREAESRLNQAISRWEGEKVDRLRFKKDFFAKCSEAQEQQRTVRDLNMSLKEATDRLSKYDGLPESQQIQQRLRDLEEDLGRARNEAVSKEAELEERDKDVKAIADKVRDVERERDLARDQIKTLRENAANAHSARNDAMKNSKKAARALEKARKHVEDGIQENEHLKEEMLAVRNDMKRIKKDAPWLFKAGVGGQNPASFTGQSVGATNEQEQDSRRNAASGQRMERQRSLPSDSSSDEDDGVTAESMVGEANQTGPKAVAELLRRHPKRCELQRRGLRALRDLAYKGDDERAAVAAVGGVAAAVHAMRRFPTDSTVQIGGIKTLAHVAFGNNVNRIEAGSRGGPAAIIQAMAAFPSNSELQGEACTAVTNLSHNCDRNRRLVVEDGGLILILNAMQAFPGDAKLQRQACWALLTLAANDEISRMIANEGGVGAIIAAMINNAGDTSVQHFGCWALANVGWGQADVQKFAREEGAMEAIQGENEPSLNNDGILHAALFAQHPLRCKHLEKPLLRRRIQQLAPKHATKVLLRQGGFRYAIELHDSLTEVQG